MVEQQDGTGAILAAIRFAAGKHSTQRRKDTLNTPYINHPIQVVELLWSVGCVRDVNTLLAAVLHDTLEDTNTKPAEICSLFGEEVLTIVQEVTDDKSLPSPVRKQLQVETSAHKSLAARQVKLADKICNLHDLVHSPPWNWTRKRKQEYLLWTKAVVDTLRGTNPFLEQLYDQEYARGKSILG